MQGFQVSLGTLFSNGEVARRLKTDKVVENERNCLNAVVLKLTFSCLVWKDLGHSHDRVAQIVSGSLS